METDRSDVRSRDGNPAIRIREDAWQNMGIVSKVQIHAWLDHTLYRVFGGLFGSLGQSRSRKSDLPLRGRSEQKHMLTTSLLIVSSINTQHSSTLVFERLEAEWTKSGDMVVDDSDAEQEVAKRKEEPTYSIVIAHWESNAS